jgi:hypothetical protein
MTPDHDVHRLRAALVGDLHAGPIEWIIFAATLAGAVILFLVLPQ